MGIDFKAKLSIQEISFSSGAKEPSQSKSMIMGSKIWEVRKGEKIHLNYGGVYYPLEIKEVDVDLVVLHTENLNVQGFSEGSVLRPEPMDINLHKGKFVILRTPTYDSGMKWKITLIS